MPTKVRFVKPWGRRVWLRAYWDGCEGDRIHNAMILVGDYETQSDEEMPGGDAEDYEAVRWPTKCDQCSAAVPSDDEEARRHVFRRTLYIGADGQVDTPRVGDCYWYDYEEHGGHCIHGWTNCDGRHLFVHVPNPSSSDPTHDYWDVMGRASNCTQQQETTHRCWVLHGTPEEGNLHVDKAGHTCEAGGGSLQTAHWHGCLHNGELTP